MERLPALYLGHGAPPLLEDPEWPAELRAWSERLPRPSAILIVSAHWESAPVTVGATTPVPLTYDFYGFPLRYYQMRYDAPVAPDLAARVAALMPDHEEVAQDPDRGLDHGAFVPLMAMYPEADIPVLQMSMPDLDPAHLFALGQRLAPLRDEGVLIIGSGFMTHGLPYIHEYMATGKPGAPAWSRDFDLWASEVARQSRPRCALRLPPSRARHAVCASHGRALRAALRRAGCGDRARRSAELHDRRLLVRPGQAIVRGRLTRGWSRRQAPRSRHTSPGDRCQPRSTTYVHGRRSGGRFRDPTDGPGSRPELGSCE